MRITDLLDKKSVKLDAAPSNKQETLDMAVELMGKSGKIKDIEAYRKLVTAAGVKRSIPDMYEELQKHYNRCMVFKEDPIEKIYILERLKFKTNEADKKLVRNMHPYIC